MEIFKLFGRVLVETSGAEQNLDRTDGKAKSLTSRLGGYIKTAAAWAAAVGAIIMSLSGAMKLVTETAAKGDAIDKNSQKIGISAQAYQEWDAVLQHCGTSMEQMGTSFKTLAQAAQNGSKEQQAAFKAIGISAQEAANLTTEELWSRTISGLQQLESGTERTYYATKLLGKGAQELGPLLNTSAEATQTMIDRVHELGGVMSDDAVAASAHFQDNLQDLNTLLDGIKTTIGAKLLPVINSAMDYILAHSDQIMAFVSGVFDFIAGLEPIATAFLNGILTVANALKQAFADLNEASGGFGIEWADVWQFVAAAIQAAAIVIAGSIKVISTALEFIIWMFNAVVQAAQTAAAWISQVLSMGSSVSSGRSSGRYGSFANGMEYIPFDGYTATLHKGERVLTAEENAEYSRRGDSGGGITINQYIQSVPQSPIQLAHATEAAFSAAQWS